LPSLAPPYQAASTRLEEICQTLAEQGYVIQPDFLDPGAALALATECRQLQQAGEFRPAGVGRGENWRLRDDIRADQIHWLDDSACGPEQGQYLALMAAYRQTLNRQLFLGLVEFEGHCALYPPGSFYRRHLDQFRGVEQRQVTTILYLNEDWQAEDGGQLRIELDDEQSIAVPPRLGSFVSFLSARYWHEVLPARRDRLSITGWLKTRPIGEVFPLS